MTKNKDWHQTEWRVILLIYSRQSLAFKVYSFIFFLYSNYVLPSVLAERTIWLVEFKGPCAQSDESPLTVAVARHVTQVSRRSIAVACVSTHSKRIARDPQPRYFCICLLYINILPRTNPTLFSNDRFIMVLPSTLRPTSCGRI